MPKLQKHIDAKMPQKKKIKGRGNIAIHHTQGTVIGKTIMLWMFFYLSG